MDYEIGDKMILNGVQLEVTGKSSSGRLVELSNGRTYMACTLDGFRYLGEMTMVE